jgi:hypothetical protein
MEVVETMVAVVGVVDGMVEVVEMVKVLVEEGAVMRHPFYERHSSLMEITVARTEATHRWLEMNPLRIGKHRLDEQGKMVLLLLPIKFLLVEKKWPSWLK